MTLMLSAFKVQARPVTASDKQIKKKPKNKQDPLKSTWWQLKMIIENAEYPIYTACCESEIPYLENRIQCEQLMKSLKMRAET